MPCKANATNLPCNVRLPWAVFGRRCAELPAPFSVLNSSMESKPVPPHTRNKKLQSGSTPADKCFKCFPSKKNSSWIQNKSYFSIREKEVRRARSLYWFFFLCQQWCCDRLLKKKSIQTPILWGSHPSRHIRDAQGTSLQLYGDFMQSSPPSLFLSPGWHSASRLKGASISNHLSCREFCYTTS